MGKPWKTCDCCGGNGYFMKRVQMEDGTREKYQQECGLCNGFGILIRNPKKDSEEKRLAYRKMRGLFAS